MKTSTLFAAAVLSAICLSAVSQETEELDMSSAFGHAPSDKKEMVGTIKVRPAEPEMQIIVDSISDLFTGLNPASFEVRQGPVPNASAIEENNRRYIVYSAPLFKKAEGDEAEKWRFYGILAHEVAHHLNAHSFRGEPNRLMAELDADKFSGFALQRLGASRPQAQAAVANISPPEGTDTHPPREDRLQAVADGWNDACEKKYECRAYFAEVDYDEYTIEQLRANLAFGYPVNSVNSRGETALIRIANSGQESTEFVKMLLSAGADVNAADNDGETALMQVRNAEVVEMLLSAGANVNAADDDGETALMEVALLGYAEVAEILLSAGADVNAVDDDGSTALMRAAFFDDTTWMLVRKDAEIAKVLLDGGANPNAANRWGETALMRAADFGHAEVAEILLSAGADVNAMNNNGETALMKASSAEIVEMLLSAGADVNAVDNDGETTLMRAAFFEYAVFEYAEVVKMLLSAGVNVNATDNDGWTALMEVALFGYAEVAEILLSAGADVNAKNKDGKTALDWAKEKGHSEVVRILEEAGAKE